MPRAKNTAEGVKAQLDQIEALLKDLTKAVLNPRVLSTTWANIMTAEMQTASISSASTTARHTVRVQVPQVKDLSNEEILKEIKKIISRAAAI